MPEESKGLKRRTVLRSVIGVGVSLTLSPRLAVAQADAASARPMEGDLLVAADDPQHAPLTPEDVPVSAPKMAWAMDPHAKIVRSGSPLNRVLLVRLDPGSLSADTAARAAGGVVAYSGVCTHEGCDVGGWIAAEGVLFCECHESKFEPRDAARVVDGPAPRGLPALPLKLSDGALVVARPFTARVGVEP